MDVSNLTTFVPSPDGAIVAVAMRIAKQSFIAIITTTTGEEIARFETPNRINYLAFSSNGRLLLGCDRIGEVHFWDMETKRWTGKVKAHFQFMYGLAASPTEPLFATAYATTIHIWDLHKRVVLRSLHGHLELIEHLAFSPDGKTLASASQDGTVRLWSVQLGQEVATLRVLEPGEEGEHRVMSVAFSPDGNMLAAVSNSDQLKVWRAKSLNELSGFRQAAPYWDP